MGAHGRPGRTRGDGAGPGGQRGWVCQPVTGPAGPQRPRGEGRG